MLNFCQFWNAINGEMYVDVPPPVEYKMADYNISSLGNGEKSAELRPLTDEDMGRYAADDVAAQYAQLHQGKNPMGLGAEMTDGEFRKFMGQTW
jgi:hypothetical protein